jgi:hypothetical protein
VATSYEASFETAIVLHCIDEVNVDLLVPVRTRSAEAYVVEDSVSEDGCELQFFSFLSSLVTVLFIDLDCLGVVTWYEVSEHVDRRSAEGV